MVARAHGDPIYTMTHDPARYPYDRIKQAADLASLRDAASAPQLTELMKDPDPAVRYWAAVGCSVRGQANIKETSNAIPALQSLLKDSAPTVRIASAEALVWLNDDHGLPALVAELDAPSSDTLLCLNALTALGDKANPAAPQITAKIKKGIKTEETGEKYSERAATDLAASLAR
jgi:HEAT repeat protein